MSKNQTLLPYTEIVERAAKTARNEDDLPRVRAAVQTEYSEIQRREDWIFLFARTALAAVSPYTTGNATASTQGTTVSFSSDAVTTASMTGRKIKFSTNDNVYDFTFSNSTAGTINPPLSGSLNVQAASYSIFQPIYNLPRDFARLPKNGGVLLQQGGRTAPIPETSPQEWYQDYSPFPGTPEKLRIVQVSTDGVSSVEFNPPPGSAFLFPVEYLRRLDPLRETTAGFVDISAGGTAVTGSAGTTLFTEARTGWFIRIDAFGKGADSEWYRVAAITHNSSLTLATAFGLSGATTARYTLCPVPDLPEILHNALMYGAVTQVMADQNDPLYAFMASQKSAVLLDARRIYKTRVYSQFMDNIVEDYQYRR